MLGVLTSITGILLDTELGLDDPALTGVVATLGYPFTGVGQLIDRRLPPRVSLPAACVALIVAAALIATALLGASLPPLLAAAVVVGLGTGSAVSAGVRALDTGVPAERRSATFSAYFGIIYTALALPAIGVGVVIEYANLRWASGILSLLDALLALIVLVSLRRRRQEPARA